jgi:hypothetical protein
VPQTTFSGATVTVLAPSAATPCVTWGTSVCLLAHPARTSTPSALASQNFMELLLSKAAWCHGCAGPMPSGLQKDDAAAPAVR